MTVPLRRRSPGLLNSLAALALAIVWTTLATAQQPINTAEQPKDTAPPKEAAPLPPGVQLSYNHLEAELFADANDGAFDTYTLLTAALVASGVREAECLTRYQRQFDAWAQELRDTKSVAGSPREQARAVFDFLHARILHGEYRVGCTDLTQTFERGDYNCISATVLFNCLCEQFGLKSSAVERPGHAISRLQFADDTLDVETTCPNWFDVLDHPEAVQAASKHPPATRLLSSSALVAVIYYNQGVDLIERREFARAIAANAKALRLDPSNATAQGNLLAALNNWALDLSGRHELEAAERLLHHGCSIAPYFHAFRTNLAAIRGDQ